MIVVDVEASGVDYYKNSLLSVGAVEFENPTNQFYEECKIFQDAHIDDEALRVGGFTREQITDPEKKTDREVTGNFLQWMATCGERTLAGQNPSFDLEMLRYSAYRYHLNWSVAHRVIDLHSIAWFEIKKRGIEPPYDEKHRHSALNLDRILKYVGLPPHGKYGHNALTDAKLETEAFSRLLYGRGLLNEYSSFTIPQAAGYSSA